MGWAATVLLAALGTTALLIAAVLLLRFGWTRASPARALVVNGCIAAFSLAYLLLALEVAFYHLAVQSDAFAFTLAAKRWREKHWHPINADGFRDREHSAADLAGKRVALVLGDSFAAGMGIENPEDRFADRLQALLGSDWRVVNLGMNGWSTAHELQALQQYPHRPDLVVLSYYINDMQSAARQTGCLPELGVPFEPPPPLLRPAVERSHLLNYVYWRLYRFGRSHITTDYWSRIRKCQDDPRVWAVHRRELLELLRRTRQRGAELVAVTFPHLVLLEESAALCGKVARLLERRGVPVVDMTPRLWGRDPRELVVNPLDNHPNEAVHAEVADLLFQALPRSLGPLPAADAALERP